MSDEEVLSLYNDVVENGNNDLIASSGAFTGSDGNYYEYSDDSSSGSSSTSFRLPIKCYISYYDSSTRTTALTYWYLTTYKYSSTYRLSYPAGTVYSYRTDDTTGTVRRGLGGYSGFSDTSYLSSLLRSGTCFYK